MRKKIGINQQGSVLFVALFFVLLLAAIGLSLIVNTQIEHSISGNYSKTVRATFAANTGLERLKAYLIYDYKKDPEGWNDSILVVPSGTPGSVPSTDPRIAGENYINLPGYPGASPFRPVLLPSSIQDFNNPTLVASTRTPVFAPAAGYQLLLRAVGKGSPGAGSVDPNRICMEAAGYTGTGNAYLGMKSRGMNLLEQCLVASDISVWNNIVFTTTPSSAGMGDVRVHGNVHLLGPANPIPTSTTTITVSGNAGWSNSYRDPGLTGPSYIPSILSNTLDSDEDTRTDLGAFIRVRNGLVAVSGSPELGTADVPFEGAFGCEDCGGTYGFTTTAFGRVHAHETGDYDIPADVEDVLLVPQISSQYQDRVVKALYPNYSAYLKGIQTFGGITYDLPGVQALQLGTALQTSSEVNMVFQSNTNPATNLAGKVWTARDKIFELNSQKWTIPKERTEQTALEPISATDAPIGGSTVVIDSSTDHANGKTFMLVAADTARNIFIVYKEVEPFDRTVDLDLTGSGGAVSKHFRRQVHGFIYIPSMTQATLDGITLIADMDGIDRDLNGDDQNSGLTALTNAQSQNLLRKVINALWLASQKLCLDDTLPGAIDDSCYNRPLSNGSTANDGTTWDPSISTQVNGGSSSATLRALSGEGWMFGAGVTQTSDLVTIDRGDDVRFVGKFTLFAENQFAGGNTGDFVMEAGPLSVNRYSYTTGGVTTNYSFPCYNNLGFMASHDIDLGAPGGTHDQFAGAFFAQNQLHITKQIQILGAMVSTSFLFDGGGTPDWFQAMEMPKCLPPEMIGGDPIILTKSQAFVER